MADWRITPLAASISRWAIRGANSHNSSNIAGSFKSETLTASEKPQERFLIADFALDAANVYSESA